MTDGHCLCGALRYEVDGPFVDLLHCHCSMCRKHHGTPFATWAAAPASGFRWIGDTATLADYQSSEKGHRYFCHICGSVAPMLDAKSNLALVPAGNLEGDPGLRPTKHIFVASRAAWHPITDGLPQYDEYPPEWGMPATQRAAAVTTTGVTHGSCLCGEVAFEITEPPQRLYFCHCSRCRRARSAAHGANLFYRAGAFRWTRGAALVQDYALPGAQHFGVAFCGRCGSALPRVSAARDVAVVPAGSLDGDPGRTPDAHIHVASKAPWFEITDELPQFAELPPRR